MQALPMLKPGDHVEIIAPASRCSDQQLKQLQDLLSSWQLNCIVDDAIFGEDLLCANRDELRLQCLKNALQNPRSKAIICARGGYGSMRLIPELAKIKQPNTAKLFIGMSDCTALNLFLQQKWQWPVVHGALTQEKFSPESIASVKSLLFAENTQIEFRGVALNLLAKENSVIETTITGGNLCLLQTSLGTKWQIEGDHKIILLEETSERGYRVDRMLEQLRQAAIFNQAKAIILGDFIGGEEPDGSSLVEDVLKRFAQTVAIPVVQVKGIGHAYNNFPVPLGTKATLHLGSEVRLVCDR